MENLQRAILRFELPMAATAGADHQGPQHFRHAPQDRESPGVVERSQWSVLAEMGIIKTYPKRSM